MKSAWNGVRFSSRSLRTKSDLTKHFDVAEVVIDPEAFSDYSRLKKNILGCWLRMSFVGQILNTWETRLP